MAAMPHLIAAQAGAQLMSLLVYALAARWYVAPWLERQERANALATLLWLQVFRYVALVTFSAQRDGFPISDGGVQAIAAGDLAGAALALAAIIALRYRARVGIALAWLVAAETIGDTVANIRDGIREHLMGAAGGVPWLILVFYVPLIVVGVFLLVWQLYARRGGALDRGAARATVAAFKVP